MPTDLNRLKVSLTKHGAHKVAFLIEHFDPDEIHEKVWDQFRHIKIDLAQAKANLSLDNNFIAPEIWRRIKEYGREDIFDLTFIAIVFSHHTLLDVMRSAFQNNCTILRGELIDGKAFTNFAHIIDELGYSIEHTADHVVFDISRMFYKFYLKGFVRELLELKLTEANWPKTNSLIEECLNLNLNEVFGLSAEDFTLWLNDVEAVVQPIVKAKRNFGQGLRFKEGHNPKMENDIITNPRSRLQRVTLLHNKIQTRVFEIIKKQFVSDKIGTEIPANAGSIDLVRKTKDRFILYEIKTSFDSRTNIRLGLSQLLEYAYWRNEINVEKLIIVGPAEADENSVIYLNILREKFKIPVYYQFYDVDQEALGIER